MIMHNLTPNTITLRDKNNWIVAEFPSDRLTAAMVLRVESSSINIDGHQVPIISKPERIYVPKKKEGHGYIVSTLIAIAFPERDDFFIVHDEVYDELGRIIGYRELIQL